MRIFTQFLAASLLALGLPPTSATAAVLTYDIEAMNGGTIVLAGSFDADFDAVGSASPSAVTLTSSPFGAMSLDLFSETYSPTAFNGLWTTTVRPAPLISDAIKLTLNRIAPASGPAIWDLTLTSRRTVCTFHPLFGSLCDTNPFATIYTSDPNIPTFPDNRLSVTVTPSAVPVPAGGILLFSALLAAGAWRRRAG